MRYVELLKNNRKGLVVSVTKVINNKTLDVSYFYGTNFHVDFGICDEIFRVSIGRSKRKFNKQVRIFKEGTGKNLRLSATNNDANYTRLIYTFV